MTIYAWSFGTVRNELSDGSIIWEIREKNSDHRIASAADEEQAALLTLKLNQALTDFVNASVENTVDI